MKASLRIALTIACICSGIVAFAKVFASESVFKGEISKVVDGDTVHFHDDHSDLRASDLKIRMLHIDAPEAHLPIDGGRVVGQGKWGDTATAYLDSLIPEGTKVTLVSSGFDKYRRVLGRLYYRNRDVNLQMVRGGWAVPYVICEGRSCDENFFEREKLKEYFAACDEAHRLGRGLWNSRHVLKEMPYEFRLRMQKRHPDKFVGDLDTRRLHAPEEIRSVGICRRVFFYDKNDALRAGFKF